MPIGDHIRIVTEKEYHIMSPPRRPKGEKPQITIRYLRRQIANLQIEIQRLRQTWADRDKTIARQDVELSEAADRERRAMERIDDLEHSDRGAEAILRSMSNRLAFLEGYYAKSTEANPRSSAGDTRALQDGAPTPEEVRTGIVAGRDGASPSGEIRRFGPGYSTHTDR